MIPVVEQIGELSVKRSGYITSPLNKGDVYDSSFMYFSNPAFKTDGSGALSAKNDVDLYFIPGEVTDGVSRAFESSVNDIKALEEAGRVSIEEWTGRLYDSTFNNASIMKRYCSSASRDEPYPSRDIMEDMHATISMAAELHLRSNTLITPTLLSLKPDYAGFIENRCRTGSIDKALHCAGVDQYHRALISQEFKEAANTPRYHFLVYTTYTLEVLSLPGSRTTINAKKIGGMIALSRELVSLRSEEEEDAGAEYFSTYPLIPKSVIDEVVAYMAISNIEDPGEICFSASSSYLRKKMVFDNAVKRIFVSD